MWKLGSGKNNAPITWFLRRIQRLLQSWNEKSPKVLRNYNGRNIWLFHLFDYAPIKSKFEDAVRSPNSQFMHCIHLGCCCRCQTTHFTPRWWPLQSTRWPLQRDWPLSTVGGDWSGLPFNLMLPIATLNHPFKTQKHSTSLNYIYIYII